MIKLIKSTFYKEIETKNKLVSFIKRAKQLSFGPECEMFEKRFAMWQGREHSVMLNSGSSANLAIIQALLNLGRIKRGDKVAFSALTWSTNVMPLLELGLEPVPVDVELDTLNVSSQTFLEVLKKTSVSMLMITNLLGFCDDIDAVASICRKNNILFTEDNCESLGTVYKGTKLGNWGLASTFSFYVGHHISTIEGGAVATDDEELATMLRLVRAHGWDRNLSFTKQTEMRNKFKVNSTFYSRYTFYDLGYNLRPTEINGFIGNTQIPYFDEIVAKREKNFLRLAQVIYKNSKRYFPLHYSHMDLVSNFAIPLVCRTQKIRDELVERCSKIIEIRPIVGGDMTMQPFFARYSKNTFSKQISNAGLIHTQGLYFGNNPELTDKELRQIEHIFS
ncbi:DegT/DnrJ/EryC1/StrS family aminotransferase [Candidatus Gottesmanbacteria bacterium]|nr:DegT/DnrJ/EryC1/StrS family aminotransferase [Candidatus Gottesmanbacteria bacterium]